MLKHIYRSFTWLYLLIDSTVYSYINTFVYTHTHTHTHTRSLSSISRDGFVYIAEGQHLRDDDGQTFKNEISDLDLSHF
jgi:hypothetical protein